MAGPIHCQPQSLKPLDRPADDFALLEEILFLRRRGGLLCTSQGKRPEGAAGSNVAMDRRPRAGEMRMLTGGFSQMTKKRTGS